MMMTTAVQMIKVTRKKREKKGRERKKREREVGAEAERDISKETPVTVIVIGGNPQILNLKRKKSKFSFKD